MIALNCEYSNMRSMIGDNTTIGTMNTAIASRIDKITVPPSLMLIALEELRRRGKAASFYLTQQEPKTSYSLVLSCAAVLDIDAATR
jgi:hypothetical protein